MKIDLQQPNILMVWFIFYIFVMYFCNCSVTSEDERIAEKLKSGDEIKTRYLKTLQRYVNYQKGLSALNCKTPLTALQSLAHRLKQ